MTPLNVASFNFPHKIQIWKSQFVTSNGDRLKKIAHLREEMNDILADQNDINESTRSQLDAISTALAELQADKTKLAAKPRRPIGFNV